MTSEKYTDRALRAKQVAEKLGVSFSTRVSFGKSAESTFSLI